MLSMKVILLVFFLHLFVSSINAIPPMNDYFISVNNNKCSLLSLSADVSVTYETPEGIKSVTLELKNKSQSEIGICGNDPGLDKAQFNVSLNDNEKLIFDFDNINNNVILKDIIFEFNLNSEDFPNATNKDMVIAMSTLNKTLSKTSQYYQCSTPASFNLSNGVTVNVYEVKVKVFNVMNESFGVDKFECKENDVTTSSLSPSSISPGSTGSESALTTTESSTTSESVPPITTESTPSSITTEYTTSPTKNGSSTSFIPTGSSTSTADSTTSFIPTGSSTSTAESTTSFASTGSSTSTAESTTPSITTESTTSPTESTNSSTTMRSSTSFVTTVSTTSRIPTNTNPYVTTASPSDLKFEIMDGTKICLLLQSKMTLSVTYDTSKKTVEELFPVTSSIDYSGMCSSDEDNITLSYNKDINFVLSFSKNEKLIKLNSLKIHVFLSNKYFPDAKNKDHTLDDTYTFGSLYEVPLGNGYSCESNLTLGNLPMKVYLQDFKFEAFRTANNTNFSDHVTSCKRDPIVAIIVGVVLAAFLIIVIIIFVIFQIRAKRRQGYQEI